MERILETRTLETEDFINRSSKIHNNKYDYSETVYVRANEKVIIICHKHGEFEQLPRNHVKGIGCRKCGLIKGWKNKKKTTEQFINEARLIHGYRYDYSLVVYKSCSNNVDIICKKHGAFRQTPSSHLSGSGCFECGKLSISKHNEENPSGWGPSNWESSAKKSKEFDSFKVYILKCYNNSEVFYKIGRTFKEVKKRFHCKDRMPYQYDVLKEFVFDTAKEAFDKETDLKRINKENKYIPLIKFGGRYECFKYMPVT